MSRHAALLLVLLPVGTLYALTAAAVVLGGDNAEFATLLAVGGVAHPSGYPLYVMMLRLASSLPASSPAHAAALATSGIALVAVAGVYASGIAWGADRTSALLSTVVFGLSPRFWDIGTQAEVFALHAAIASGLVALSAPGSTIRGLPRVASLGLLAGLGASNNLTIVLLAPVVGAGVFSGVVESAHRGRGLAIGVALTFVGLSPYLWMMHVARSAGPNALVWGDVTTFEGVLRHAARVDYGTFTHAAGAAAVPAGEQLRAFTVHVFRDLSWLPAALGFLSAPLSLVAAARAGDRRRVFSLAALAGAFLLAGPGFAAISNVPPRGPGLAVIRRFFVLPELLVCPFIAVGVRALLERLALGRLYRAGLVASALLLATTFSLPVVEAERQPTLERYLHDTLRSVPEGAVVLGSSDDRVFGFAYAQRALRLRPDVLFVSPILLHHDWYRQGISAALGAAVPPPANGSVSTVALAELILATGRALFLAEPLGGAVLRNFPSYPIGTVQRVLPRGEGPPAPPVLERENAALFEGFAPRSSLPDASPWSPPLLAAYARPWWALADAYDRMGDSEGARRCRDRARSFDAPDRRSADP